MWLAKGDESGDAGDAKMERQRYEKASYDYNMAGQYYVKGAAAGSVSSESGKDMGSD